MAAPVSFIRLLAGDAPRNDIQGQALSFRPQRQLGEVETLNALAVGGHRHESLAVAGELQGKHVPPRLDLGLVRLEREARFARCRFPYFQLRAVPIIKPDFLLPLASQIRTVLSRLPVAIVRPSGAKATQGTPAVWPRSTTCSLPARTSQR